jgi:hypothetical protein
MSKKKKLRAALREAIERNFNIPEPAKENQVSEAKTTVKS